MNTVNYFHVAEQTREEKIAMYEKLSKKELIAMLLENQRLVDQLTRQQAPIVVNPPQPYYPNPGLPCLPTYPTVNPIWVVDERSQPIYTTCIATT